MRHGKSESALLKDLVVEDEAVGDGQEVLFDFLTGDFVAGNAEDRGGAVREHDQGVDNERVVFGTAAKTIGKLRHEPGAAGAGKLGMEDIAPGVEQELVLVGALFDEF